MLTEEEVERIRKGLHEGVRGPIVVTWVEKLLRDRDERLKRDQEIATKLLGRDVWGL